MRLGVGFMLAVVAALALPTSGRGSMIAQYNFQHSGATSVSLNTMETPTYQASNASAVNLSLGAKTDYTTDEGSAVNWYWSSPTPDYLSVSRDTSAAATDDTNYYVQFTVTAAANYRLDVASITLVAGAGGGSANQRSFYVFDSVDGLPSGSNDVTGKGSPYASHSDGTLIGENELSAVRGTSSSAPGGPMNDDTIAFPSDDQFVSTFEVRIYFDTPMDGQNIDLGSITLNGSVVPVPEPRMLAGFGLLALIGLGMRPTRRLMKMR